MGPRVPHVGRLTWRHGAFLHWPFEPSAIRQHVPYPLELDTYDGRGWVGVLPFVATGFGIRGTPSWARLTFPECNLRTYVTHDDERAVYFFSIDVANRMVASLVGGIARLPCYRARMNVIESDGRVRFSSRRVNGSAVRAPSRAVPDARLDVTYQPTGDVFRAAPGSLAHWLTSPRRFYAPRNGRLVSGAVAHEPWPLQPTTVDVHQQTVTDAVGLPPPTGEPHVLYCEKLRMTATVHGPSRSLRSGVSGNH